MSAERLMQSYARLAGWDEERQLEICLEYISNQQDDDCFENHLQAALDDVETDSLPWYVDDLDEGNIFGPFNCLEDAQYRADHINGQVFRKCW